MIDKELYLGSYEEGTRPTHCAYSDENLVGRHSSNHTLTEDLFFSILTKHRMNLNETDMEEVRAKMKKRIAPTRSIKKSARKIENEESNKSDKEQ